MRQPNIVLIMTDQHARRVSGCYGDPIVRTPHLDALAARGTLFEHAYCNAPLCCPSRMSFLTGRHPHEISVWANSARLDSELPTFAHALDRAGYDTVLCGRMHFNGPDQRHGFGARIFPDSSGHAEGTLEGASGYGRACIDKSGPGRNHHLLYDEECVAEARRWLDARQGVKPFLLVVGLISPHTPLVCPRETFDRYFKQVDLPAHPPGHFEQMHPYNRRYRANKGVDTCTEHETRRARAAYYGMIEHTDAQIGLLLESLAAQSFAGETAIVYTSDHGEMAGQHGLWTKMTFYEDSTGVPLIASWPGRVREGARVAQPVSLVDLAPTLTDWAGTEPIPHASGGSLQRLLAGKPDAAARRVFSELLPENHKKRGPTGGPSRMLVDGGWKCNVYHGEAPELFCLDEDPGELQDRAADPACKQRLESMQAALFDGWNPEAIVTREAERIACRAFLSNARSDPKSPPDSKWKGPEGYGFVEAI